MDNQPPEIKFNTYTGNKVLGVLNRFNPNKDIPAKGKNRQIERNGSSSGKRRDRDDSAHNETGGEEASPYSLVDLVLHYLASNLEKFCWKRPDGSLSLHAAAAFPQEVAERLLQTMADQGMLNEGTVGIFRGNQLRLKHAYIRKAKISAVAFLRAFCHHKLVELDATGASSGLSVTNLLNALSSNKWIRGNLQRLILQPQAVALEHHEEGCFSRFSGLRSLSITNVLFCNKDLADVASLPHLERLDISDTFVSDITVLLECKDRLKYLTMHNLEFLNIGTTRLLKVIKELTCLIHLDISTEMRNRSDMASCLLEENGILPNLVSLDISGRKHLTDRAVEAFITQHPQMQFIGLLNTGAGYSELLYGDGNLKVTGEANQTQIMEALQRYSDRAIFVQEALFHLVSQTEVMDEPNPKMLKLVVIGMNNHPADLSLQEAACCCVYHLTKDCLSTGMPVRLLAVVTQQLLEAMSRFTDEPQLQKRCVYALCNDKIMKEVPFNRFLAAKVLMRCLCFHEDEITRDRAVALLSIMTSQISAVQKSLLCSEIAVIRALLHTVHQKTILSMTDNTFIFTLLNLINLTKDVPITCHQFIQNQGLELFMKVLEINVAAVKELLAQFMIKDFISQLCKFMQSEDYLVRSFAAQIAAYLVFWEDATWTLDSSLRESLREQLVTDLYLSIWEMRAFGDVFTLVCLARELCWLWFPIWSSFVHEF
ncbi:protein zyg-11 homolog [Hyperolius riggenbachi]|uniref:protein zyg-11 homolog n=1 Tax=Hyperolius riggenbachi TaxID=752182 RepID=UPI0035A34B82